MDITFNTRNKYEYHAVISSILISYRQWEEEWRYHSCWANRKSNRMILQSYAHIFRQLAKYDKDIIVPKVTGISNKKYKLGGKII